MLQARKRLKLVEALMAQMSTSNTDSLIFVSKIIAIRDFHLFVHDKNRRPCQVKISECEGKGDYEKIMD